MLDELVIQGIRSFDPIKSERIKFQTPLTLIVGKNGCGKTTIIECLRYATTGDMPPNTKGGAFIHDPKIFGESEVKAKVELRFKDIRGRDLGSTRAMNLVAKKTKCELKTLENLISVKPPGEKKYKNVSNRCVDADEFVASSLGVSPAILSNVIFCHQEDSNWPLSEPSILKKKFDDIFDATKYTKALLNIKSLVKSRKVQLLLKKQNLAHTKENLESAEKLLRNIDLREQQLKECEEMTESLLHQISALDQKMEALNLEMKRCDEKANKLNQLKNEKSMVMRNMNELKNTLLKEMSNVSDNDLKDSLENHRRNSKSFSSKIADLEAKKLVLQHEINSVKGALESQFSERGLKIGNIQNHEAKGKRLQELISRFAGDLNLAGFENLALPVTDAQIDSFIRLVGGKCESGVAQIETLRNESKEAEAKISSEIQSLESNKSSCNEVIRIRGKTLETEKRNLESICKELREMEQDCSRLESVKESLQQSKKAMEACKESIEMESFDSNLEKLEKSKTTINEDIKKCMDKMNKVNASSEIAMKIDFHKKNLRETSINLAALEAELVTVLEPLSYPVIPEMAQLNSHLSKKKLSLQDLLKDLERNNMERSSLQATLAMTDKRIDSMEKELYDKKVKIDEVTCGKSLNLEIERVEKEISSCEEILLSSESSAIMVYERFLRKFESEDGCCPLCHRGFGCEKESFDFADHLKKLISSLPSQSSHALDRKRDLQKRLQELRDLISIQSDLQDLDEIEIPALQEESLSINTRLEAISITIDDQGNSVQTLKQEIDRLTMVTGKVQEYWLEKQKKDEISGQLVALQNQCTESRLASNVSLDDVREEMKELRFQESQIASEIKTLRDRSRSLQDQYSTALQTYHSNKDRFNSLVSMNQKKEQLEGTRQSLSKSISDAESEIAHLQRDLEMTLLPKIDRLKGQRELDGRSRTARESELMTDLERWKKAHFDVRNLYSEYRRFSASTMRQELELIEKDVQKNEDQLRQWNHQIDSICEQVNLSSKENSEIETIERNLLDNIRLREQGRRLERLEKEIEKVGSWIESADYEGMLEYLKELSMEKSKLFGIRSEKMGEKRQLEVIIGDNRMDLAKLGNVQEIYKSLFIEVNTTEMALQDLETYAKTLDNAIMKFHSLKMEEINRTIRDLWLNTYKGTDIDNIAIKTEVENSSSNRSYNYRVVMQKGQAEIDMRGRCSAGQRVLTSLIIRLALAESFSVNCGILALDEPTTNLDHANMESLAGSLANIIRLRQDQSNSNFQLIVITHDEEFLRLLGRSEYVEKYYYVYKDDNNHSRIVQQTIP